MRKTENKEAPTTCAAMTNQAGIKICPLSGLPCRCRHWESRECPCLAMARKRKQAEDSGDNQIPEVLR